MEEGCAEGGALEDPASWSRKVEGRRVEVNL